MGQTLKERPTVDKLSIDEVIDEFIPSVGPQQLPQLASNFKYITSYL